MSEELSFALSTVGGLVGALLLVAAWFFLVSVIGTNGSPLFLRAFSFFFASVAFALVIWLILPVTYAGDKTEAVFNLTVARFWEITKNFAIVALIGLGLWKGYELLKANGEAKTEESVENEKE
ncbi:hypothetical protein IID21_04390 [Patescibacteria group bacterium]|nr:hypothetical protein [Patescibacteria group bacterium]